MSNSSLANPGQVLKNRWRIEKKIGGGGFGEVYIVKDLKTHRMLAMKTESNKARKQTLKMEVVVLKKLQGSNHVCKFYGCGRQAKYNYIIMALVGKNLSDLRKEAPDGILSLSTAFRLLRQMINCLQLVHDAGYLHRDVKPNNFAMGCTKETFRTVFVLDFGLARLHVSGSGDIRPARKVAGFRGTLRYASINSHYNKELGRVDDFWCLFYLAVEFTKGCLPWSKLSKKEEIGTCKRKSDHAGMIHHLPSEFGQYLCHVQKLSYSDRPNYDHLRHVCDRILSRYRVRPDEPFDWEKGANCSVGQLAPSLNDHDQVDQKKKEQIGDDQIMMSSLSCQPCASDENDEALRRLRMDVLLNASNMGLISGPISTRDAEVPSEFHSDESTQVK